MLFRKYLFRNIILFSWLNIIAPNHVKSIFLHFWYWFYLRCPLSKLCFSGRTLSETAIRNRGYLGQKKIFVVKVWTIFYWRLLLTSAKIDIRLNYRQIQYTFVWHQYRYLTAAVLLGINKIKGEFEKTNSFERRANILS